MPEKHIRSLSHKKVHPATAAMEFGGDGRVQPEREARRPPGTLSRTRFCRLPQE